MSGRARVTNSPSAASFTCPPKLFMYRIVFTYCGSFWMELNQLTYVSRTPGSFRCGSSPSESEISLLMYGPSPSRGGASDVEGGFVPGRTHRPHGIAPGAGPRSDTRESQIQLTPV